MNIIKELFRVGLHNEEVTRESIELNSQIEYIARKINLKEINQETMIDYLYEASSCGEVEGFILGFKVAVTLMAECFI